ncbi:hypothetical protein BH09PAT1_BH09PAT1_5540 [soil metagenome]
MNTLFGKKVQQTQRFLENGTRIPVTLVVAVDNVILSLKTQEKDKYSAVKLGYGKSKKSTKALLGEAKKANLSYAPVKMAEVRMDDTTNLELGKTILVDEVFKSGDIVDVTGMSKGKGFASGIKRYNFRGGPKTHGQSDRHRAPGSIGSGTTPGRVYKGKRMAGNMGRDTVTVKNLVVIEVNGSENALLISGLVPGILNGTVKVTKVGETKAKNFVPLFKIEEPVVETTNVAEVAPEIEQVTAPVEETVPVEEQSPVVETEKNSQEIVVEESKEETK